MSRTLGNRLKEAREAKRLTQVEVAEKLGISNGTLSGYERDYRDPDTDTLSRLAEMYDVSLDWLKGRTNDKKTVLADPSRKLIDMLDLSDEEIYEKMSFGVDGMKLTYEEVTLFLAFVRAERIRKKLDSPSTKSSH